MVLISRQCFDSLIHSSLQWVYKCVQMSKGQLTRRSFICSEKIYQVQKKVTLTFFSYELNMFVIYTLNCLSFRFHICIAHKKSIPFLLILISILLFLSRSIGVKGDENTATINTKDLGILVRSLGFCPTEAEIKEMIVEAETAVPLLDRVGR